MESACLPQYEDGVPPAAKSLWGGASQVAPNIVSTRSPARKSRTGSAAAAADEVVLESSHNHLLLEKLITQQLAAGTAINPSLLSVPFARAPGNARATTKGSKLGTGPATEYSEKRIVVKYGTPSRNSSCMKRSSSAVAAQEFETENGAGAVRAAARVRARRGEATDNHSIAERTRRTRISVRLAALHRLIPDASKTIKASMLDEVIQYVTTLQARLKTESAKNLDIRSKAFATMCPNAPFDIEEWRKNCNRAYVNKMIERVLDPQEERLAEVEHQVMSRLSHPSSDLSHISTYLASLGLVLLPISHLPSPSSLSKSNAPHV